MESIATTNLSDVIPTKKFKKTAFKNIMSKLKKKNTPTTTQQALIDSSINNPSLESNSSVSYKTAPKGIGTQLLDYVDSAVTGSNENVNKATNLIREGAGKAYELYDEYYGDAKLHRNTENFVNWAVESNQKPVEEDDVAKNKKFLKDITKLGLMSAASGFLSGTFFPSHNYPLLADFAFKVFSHKFLS